MEIRRPAINSERSLITAFSNVLSYEICLLKLELNDGSKTLVAQSHRNKSGMFGKPPRLARLEISSGFESLVDIILVTFVFAEKLRKDWETC